MRAKQRYANKCLLESAERVTRLLKLLVDKVPADDQVQVKSPSDSTTLDIDCEDLLAVAQAATDVRVIAEEVRLAAETVLGAAETVEADAISAESSAWNYYEVNCE